jgi:hypothetical protein
MSAKLAARVTGNNTGGPPLLGSAVAEALGLALAEALALAVELALIMALAEALELALIMALAEALELALIMALAEALELALICAEATGANSKTTTALKANRSSNFFIKHPLYLSQVPSSVRAPTFPFSLL